MIRNGMIRNDYAGPGGVCEALHQLGLDSYGIEWEPTACATRAAAGHLTVRADLATYRPGGEPGGYWGSPPCPTFSVAGLKQGRLELQRILEAIDHQRWGDAELMDPATRHVVDAARTAVTLHPEWIAMEQVVSVLPAWEVLAGVLNSSGYSTWTGVLCAADYGVPQKRNRAFLVASRIKDVNRPAATHTEKPGMIGPQHKWVTMHDALGWDGLVGFPRRADRGRKVTIDGIEYRERDLFDTHEPAPTLTEKARSWQLFEDGQRRQITVPEALTLQGFPAGYPVAGSRTAQFHQVANAVPPPLASAVIVEAGATINRMGKAATHR